MSIENTTPQSWRLALRLARAGIGALCLGTIVSTQGIVPSAAIWLVFTVYGIATVVLPWMDGGTRLLAPLMVDLTFFFIWLSGGVGPFAFTGVVFFLFVILSAAIVHSWREVLIAGISVMLFLLITRVPGADRLLVVIASGSLIAFILSLQKHSLLDRITDAGRDAELHRARAASAGELERQRIAADFHDGPLQSFISFQMRLQIVKKMLERDQAAGIKELEQLQELCHSQVAELRAFIRGMRPPDDDGAGLLTASGRLVELFQKDTGIVATFHRGAPLGSDEPETATEILQLLREALNNVQKHSKASRVAVSMGRVDNMLEITVEDDGTGFPFAGSYSLDELDALHLGPVSIKHRVRNLGGEFTVESRPGHGAGLQIRVPL